MEVCGRERRKQKTLPIDPLSRLPDSVLYHILSFLPTKNSVATSILARRWRSLWRSVPNLEFFCYEDEDPSIIDRVLKRHKPASLKSLKIYSEHCDCDHLQVKRWITAAINRNVQFLHLYVGYYKPLPPRLLTCETLVDLRLRECGKIPTLVGVCLPHLKQLYLISVQFKDEESLPCLLSGCPVLEDLLIKSNVDIRLNSWYISSATVKWLHLETLTISLDYLDEQGHKLEINTPALEYLSVVDYLSGPIESQNMTSLITADIVYQDDGMGEDATICSESLLKFVDGLSNVRCLNFDLSEFRKITNSLLSVWTTSFNNLTKLKLTAVSCFLSKFLENANNLEILEFQDLYVRKTNGWIEPEQVPKCLSHLRTVKIGRIMCAEVTLEIVRYLLRNAKVLKRMDITYPRGKNDLLQKISLFERGSEACELAFKEEMF